MNAPAIQSVEPIGPQWTVFGRRESTDEYFTDYVDADTAVAAATAVRVEQGEEVVIISVHPGRIPPAVPDDEWEHVNEMLVCENANEQIDGCEGLYDDGGDGFDGYCPTCADRREESGANDA